MAGRTQAAIVLACLAVLAILAIAAHGEFGGRCRGCGGRGKDGFFTEFAQEEPTRSYVPYTGTVPFGTWGTLPWAEAVPLPRGGEYRCDMGGDGWGFLTRAGGRQRVPLDADGAYWNSAVPAIE